MQVPRGCVGRIQLTAGFSGRLLKTLWGSSSSFGRHVAPNRGRLLPVTMWVLHWAQQCFQLPGAAARHQDEANMHPQRSAHTGSPQQLCRSTGGGPLSAHF